MRVLLYGGPCRCLLTPLPCISSPACSVASLYTAKQLPQVVHIPPPLCGLPSVAKKLQCMCFACSEGGKAGLGDSLGAFCRWFIVDDVDMLEEDLQLLKSLFDAEGEGLSRQQIEELCAPLAGLLVVMQLDSGILMGNYKQVPAAVVLCMHFRSRKNHSKDLSVAMQLRRGC